MSLLFLYVTSSVRQKLMGEFQKKPFFEKCWRLFGTNVDVLQHPADQMLSPDPQSLPGAEAIPDKETPADVKVTYLPAVIRPIVENVPPKPREAMRYLIPKDYKLKSPQDLPFDFQKEFGRKDPLPLQAFVLDYFDPGRNAVICSGVDTGKSITIYAVSKTCIAQGGVAVCVAPNREIVKATHLGMTNALGSPIVGLYTGDSKTAAGKNVVVATTEGAISAIRRGNYWFTNGQLNVDEVHEILSHGRGQALDALITLYVIFGGKIACYSGTLPIRNDLAKYLNADLYENEYEKDIRRIEVHAKDDLGAIEFDRAVDTLKKGFVKTSDGCAYNGESVRLQGLKEEIAKREGERCIIFVPTKVIGRCLSHALDLPFYSADLDDDEAAGILKAFEDGDIPHVVATEGIATGSNTVCTLPVVCGTRRGGGYLPALLVRQMLGRGKRGEKQSEGLVIGDDVERFHSKFHMPQSLPLPTEHLALTLLCIDAQTKENLVAAVSKSFAASFYHGAEAVSASVEKFIRTMSELGMVNFIGGQYSLTLEGATLAKYMVSPEAYIAYKKYASQMDKIPVFMMPDETKGCLLLALILRGLDGRKCPEPEDRDMVPHIIHLSAQKDIQAKKAGLLMSYLKNPEVVPGKLRGTLAEAGRWVGLFNEVKKIGGVTIPCMESLGKALKPLQTAADVAYKEEKAKLEEERKKRRQKWAKANAKKQAEKEQPQSAAADARLSVVQPPPDETPNQQIYVADKAA